MTKLRLFLVVCVQTSLWLAPSVQASGWQEPFTVDSSFRILPVVARSPAAAYGGTSALVVWEDARNGRSDIYGARLAPTGEVLDSAGIPIATAPDDQFCPSVAFDGLNYLVVWQDRRTGWRWDIYGARVAMDGTVLDPEGIPLREGNADKHSPLVGYGAGRFLAVWEETLYTRNVSAAIIDSFGNPGPAFVVASGPGTQASPAVAGSDSGLLVAWHDSRNGDEQVYCARLDSRGDLLDTAGIRISPDRYSQLYPCVTSDGTQYLVAWQETALTDSDIYGLRFCLDGSVPDSAPVRISSASRRQGRPRAAFSGSVFLVAWEDARNAGSGPDVFAARVTTDGELLDPFGLVVSAASEGQVRPCVSPAGSLSVVLWHDFRHDSIRTAVYSARLDGARLLDSTGIAVTRLTKFYGAQHRPAAAYDGSNYLVVWTDFRSDTMYGNIYGIRVSGLGVPLDSAAIPVCGAPGRQDSACVAAGTNCYLVAWEDCRGRDSSIYCARVGPDGQVWDSTGILLSGPGTRNSCPAVAFNRQRFIVVWLQSHPSWQLRTATVSQTGVVRDTSHTSVYLPSAKSPGVASGDSVSLAVWSTHVVFAARMDSVGMLIDTFGFLVSLMGTRNFDAHVGFGANSFLATWLNDNPYGNQVFGMRVNQQGVLLDTAAIGISSRSPNQDNPRSASDGAGFVVVWQSLVDSVWHIQGARVRPNGVVSDTTSLLAREPGFVSPDICNGPGRDLFIVCSGMVDSLGGHPVGRSRIWGLLTEFPLGMQHQQPPDFATEAPLPTLVNGTQSLHTATAASLLDITGRRVMELRSGNNDIRHVAPGVYFVRLEAEGLTATQKLVMQR